jgi:hypothetical protein
MKIEGTITPDEVTREIEKAVRKSGSRPKSIVPSIDKKTKTVGNPNRPQTVIEL